MPGPALSSGDTKGNKTGTGSRSQRGGVADRNSEDAWEKYFSLSKQEILW